MATVAEIIRSHAEYAAARGSESFVASVLQRCQQAVLLLGERLREIGYPAESFLSPVHPSVDAHIAEVEKHTTRRIPEILKCFWRQLGGVSLIDLQNYRHVEFWDGLGIAGPHGFCDGLHVDNCDREWIEYTFEDFIDFAEEDAEDEFLFSFSPDGYQKDDISGGAPYGLRDGEECAEVVDFQWSGYRMPLSARPGALDFMAYLRTAVLECGGFPALLGHPDFEPIRLRLVDGLPAF